MAQIDLSQIVEEFNLDIDAMSRVLFPNNKYPRPAFERILKGQTKLDEDQIALLADYLSINIQDMYSTNGWRGGLIKNNLLTIKRGNFTATLNFDTFKTTLMNGDELIDDVLLSSNMISLKEYTSMLDKYINAYINK